MSGDIVERLREECDEQTYIGHADLVVLLSTAADEIMRLRAAGDAMAKALDALCHSYCGNDDDADLVDAWQEARRG